MIESCFLLFVMFAAVFKWYIERHEKALSLINGEHEDLEYYHTHADLEMLECDFYDIEYTYIRCEDFRLVFSNFENKAKVFEIQKQFHSPKNTKALLNMDYEDDVKTFKLILDSLSNCGYTVLPSFFDNCDDNCRMLLITDYFDKIPLYQVEGLRMEDRKKSMLITYDEKRKGVRMVALYYN